MVRKWSYLNENLINFDNYNVSNCALKYNFKVFKVTTKFRKYNLGYTLMTRKKYSRRRHKTNWITMSYIVKYWVSFFLKSKQFIRFYQNIGLFEFKSYSADMSLFNKQFGSLKNYDGINSYGCSKNILLKFLNSNRKNYLSSPLRSNMSSGLMFNTSSGMDLSEILAPGLVSCDNQLFNFSSFKFLNNTKHNVDLNNLIFSYTLKIKVIIYQLMILISLFVIKVLNVNL